MPTKCNEKHWCHCGTASHSPHETGKEGCKRYVTKAPKRINRIGNGGVRLEWMINGHPMTDYTLHYQRGYSQHECGCWTTAGGSSNSLEGDW